MITKNPNNLDLSRGFEMRFEATGKGYGKDPPVIAKIKGGTAIIEKNNDWGYTITSSKPTLKRGSSTLSYFGLFGQEGWGPETKWILRAISKNGDRDPISAPTPDSWTVRPRRRGRSTLTNPGFPVEFRQDDANRNTRRGRPFSQRPGSGLAKLPPRATRGRSPTRRRGRPFSQRPGSGLAKLPPRATRRSPRRKKKGRKTRVRSPIMTRSKTKGKKK